MHPARTALVLPLLAACMTCGCRGNASREAAPTALAPSAASSVAPPAAPVGTTASEEPAWPPAEPERVVTDWCTAAMSVLDEETCYVLPDAPPRELLVYLHGIVPPTPESAQKTKLGNVVASASRRAGVAALLPRGKQGFARGRWWGWPTSEPAFSQQVPSLMASIAAKRTRLEELVGFRFGRVYYAGSSAGGYFAAALALRGSVEADGFGAMSGAAGQHTAELARLPPKPFYIGYGAHDSVRASSRALGAVLRRAGWPVQVAEHAVGHGAQEVYLDEAFAFWRQHTR